MRYRKYKDLETRKKKPQNQQNWNEEKWVTEDWLNTWIGRRIDLNQAAFLPRCAISLPFSFWIRWSIRSLGVTGSPKVTQNSCESQCWEGDVGPILMEIPISHQEIFSLQRWPSTEGEWHRTVNPAAIIFPFPLLWDCINTMSVHSILRILIVHRILQNYSCHLFFYC